MEVYSRAIGNTGVWCGANSTRATSYRVIFMIFTSYCASCYITAPYYAVWKIAIYKLGMCNLQVRNTLLYNLQDSVLPSWTFENKSLLSCKMHDNFLHEGENSKNVSNTNFWKVI